VECKDSKEVRNLSSKAIATIENNLSLNQNGTMAMMMLEMVLLILTMQELSIRNLNLELAIMENRAQHQ
jgi:hypothetical protein|tara:strand:+ start:194 stop:400 length:207 start_codon:yes stop_codon:yes gene_type:complete